MVADFPEEAPAEAEAVPGRGKNKRLGKRENEMKLATRHFVRPESLNHHDTAYAGKLADWMIEAAMIGVTKYLGRNDNVVLAAVKEMNVVAPIVAGTILDFGYEVVHLGVTSIVIQVNVTNMLTNVSHMKGSVVFVSVDEKGNKIPHGRSL